MNLIRENCGMTLIELVVSLGILVMILAATFSFYSAGVKSWTMSERQMEVLQNARIALDWICRDLKVAEEYEILSRQSLSITPYKSNKIIYKKAGTQLLLEKNGQEMAIADCISELGFEEMPRGIVKIELRVENNSYEVKLSTKIKPPVKNRSWQESAQ